jgi:hypothetical protein
MTRLAYLQRFNCWLQRRLISCSKRRQLLLFQFAHHLELWRLGSTSATGMSGEEAFVFAFVFLKLGSILKRGGERWEGVARRAFASLTSAGLGAQVPGCEPQYRPVHAHKRKLETSHNCACH